MPTMPELKQSMKEMDRADDKNNLYGIYRPIRKTVKQRNENLDETHLHEALRTNERVSIQKYQGREFKRGLQEEDGEVPFPVSARVGPYEVKDPIFGSKNYFWCSCGMSKKQPFCDSSHVGTSFAPIKFSLDEQTNNLSMCGCKLSKNAPFCDGETCFKLLTDEIINEEAAIHHEEDPSLQEK